MRLIYLLSLLLISVTFNPGLCSEKINSVIELWRHYPNQIRSLFRSLDLNTPKLSEVKNALLSGYTVLASETLLAHYESVDGKWVVGTVEQLPPDESINMANLIIHDSVYIVSTKDQVPPGDGGGWQLGLYRAQP